MDSIGKLAETVASRATTSTSRAVERQPTPILDRENLPSAYCPETDGETRKLVVFWSGTGEDRGSPTLRRGLAVSERQALERRSYELRCALERWPNESQDDLLAAVSGMLGAFPAMQRYDREAAATMATSYLWTCRDQPHWAIVEACERVRAKRAGLNPSFCPSEPEFMGVVQGIVAPYRRMLGETVAMLRAPVAPPEPERLTREEIEARLGRPVGGRRAEAIEAEKRSAEAVLDDLCRTAGVSREEFEAINARAEKAESARRAGNAA
jgi:hypothetical protein